MRTASLNWRRHWGLMAGIVTGLLFIALQWSSPHVGEPCSRLGEITQERRIGLPARRLMCVATVDGNLVYALPMMPPRTKLASLNEF